MLHLKLCLTHTDYSADWIYLIWLKRNPFYTNTSFVKIKPLCFAYPEPCVLTSNSLGNPTRSQAMSTKNKCCKTLCCKIQFMVLFLKLKQLIEYSTVCFGSLMVFSDFFFPVLQMYVSTWPLKMNSLYEGDCFSSS